MSMLRFLLAVDLSRCPYFTREETCESGCWSEPSCITDRPLAGWPLERLRARGRTVRRVASGRGGAA